MGRRSRRLTDPAPPVGSLLALAPSSESIALGREALRVALDVYGADVGAIALVLGLCIDDARRAILEGATRRETDNGE